MSDPRVRRPSRARLSVESMEDRLAPATFTVTSTADSVTPVAGTLRWAITQANAAPGPDVIAFQIGSGGFQSIAPVAALPLVTDRVTIAGQTQPGIGGTPLIELNGAGAGAGADGLVLQPGAAGSVVRGLVVNRFARDGLFVRADNCRIVGNYIGTDATGNVDLGNGGSGIFLEGARNNVIGGTSAAARNVLSGNGHDGIGLIGAALGNRVVGNYIGTNAAGTGDLGNSLSGVALGYGASGNLIGDAVPGARNVISGNDFYGVVVFIAGTSGNVIQGNFIGTDAAGTGDLGNSLSGVQIREGASGNVIGGTAPRARNVISGNSENGVLIQEVGTTGNRVQGNYIGTDRTGTADLGNSAYGVHIENGASGNIVGGATVGTRNVISGNDYSGVTMSGIGTSGNRVLGNYMGTNAAGTIDLGNSANGVGIGPGASGNVIGGATAGARNVISGNGRFGVLIDADTNRVVGNFIGTDRTGTAAIGNTLAGVQLNVGASGNVVGGVAEGAGNLIAHNGDCGVTIGGQRNSVLGNRIFANAGLGIELGTDGVTPNDGNDGDSGANIQFNFPELDVARLTPAGLRVRGRINTETNKTVRIEFFSSPGADPSGHGEGRRFLGFVTVSTGDGNNASFNVLLPPAGVLAGHVITATATDELGNTSEFSLALAVTT